MKLLLILVTVVAVFTVDGRDFPNHPDGRDFSNHPDGRDFSNHPDGRDFQNHPDGSDKTAANQEQIIPEDTEDQSEEQDSLDVSGGNNLVKILDSDNDDHQMIETEKEQHQRRLRRSKCKARNACVVMGGFCVTNATLCGGRLVPEGCKGTNCQCCVPGTIEARFDNLEIELQSLRTSINRSNSNMNSELLSLKDSMDSDMQTLKFNMTNSNTNLGSELQSLKDSMDNSMININNSNSNLGSELQSLKDNTNTMNSNLNSKLNIMNANLGSELQSVKYNTNNMNLTLNAKLDSMNTSLNTKLAYIAENQACPDGFFKLSDQCFKFFTDSGRTWTASKSKCQDEGLKLAKPLNPIELRRHLVMKYGNKWAWIGGKGTGSSVKWDRDGQTISSSNPMWYSGYPGSWTSSSYCLWLMSTEGDLKSHPTTPYIMYGCTNRVYALCEYLMD